MMCPRCNTANPEGSKFCLHCGAPLTGAPAATPPVPPAPSQAAGGPPIAAHHLVVHRHTSPTLWVFVAGAAVVVLVLLVSVGAGAYHVLKGGRGAPNGPAGVQPRAPVSPPPASPPGGSTGPSTSPQAPPAQPPATPAAPTPPAGPTQPPATPPGPTPPAAPAQPPSAPPQVPGQPQPPAGPQAPQQPASPLPPQPPAKAEMQAYRDPGGAFTIEYPKTWKVQRGENGYTVFYRDDREEGTLFGVFPRLVLNGQATATQILEALKRDVRQRYPDFEVKSQKIEPTAAGELAIVDARWTNSRNERMVTSLTLHVSTIGDRRSEVVLINIQAPEVAFEAVAPTFQHMFNTFVGSLARQGALFDRRRVDMSAYRSGLPAQIVCRYGSSQRAS